MTHAFHKYIATQLLRDIQKRAVVVFYDPRYHPRGQSHA